MTYRTDARWTFEKHGKRKWLWYRGRMADEFGDAVPNPRTRCWFLFTHPHKDFRGYFLTLRELNEFMDAAT